MNENRNDVNNKLVRAPEKVIGKEKPHTMRQWITEEIINLKMCYRLIRNEINKKSKQPNERFLQKTCMDVDEQMTHGTTTALKTFFRKEN